MTRLISLILISSITTLYSQPIDTNSNSPSYEDHLIDIYVASQELEDSVSIDVLQSRLYQVVNFYDSWPPPRPNSVIASDLLFYLITALYDRGHPHYPFYHAHCLDAQGRGEVDERICRVLYLLRR